MRKFILLATIAMAIAFLGCSKHHANTPGSSLIVGTWTPDADLGKDGITSLKFTAQGRYYTWIDGKADIEDKDQGMYKYDGHTLTTSFIDHYESGVAIMVKDTMACTVSGNAMILAGTTHFTRQN